MLQDSDAPETAEWLEALEAVAQRASPERASFLLDQVAAHAARLGMVSSAHHGSINTPYVNTLRPSDQLPLSQVEIKCLEHNTNLMRWNAMAIVMRAGKRDASLGGHIASFASIATLFEVGLNYFFHAPTETHGGDLIYFQGHSSPGLYARAFLEGRLTTAQLDRFRQEVGGGGLSSYPHPWLMRDFWQLPTVSMGLGPLMAIYQARFLKYMHHRALIHTANRRVWAFCGDGEMGEPESLGALNIAGREKLDNLIFVINCNLQRLDGPVWGNGQIIQEYEAVYRGAGWNVIKVIWGSGWDALFEKDKTGILSQRMGELVDGEYQVYSGCDGAFLRQHFFGKYPELLALVEDKTDEDLKALRDGGHDILKVYAAYAAAVAHTGQPTVILAKTVKGFGMGNSCEARNVSHQTKKITEDDIKAFAKRFSIPVVDEKISELPYVALDAQSESARYLHGQREKLGGYLPSRKFIERPLAVPDISCFAALLEDSKARSFSTTMAFVRILSILLKDKNLKTHVVPIAADECRTFGMEGLFRQIGIYSPYGQLYQAEDSQQLMCYREDSKGQLLQEGISEAGAMSSWLAAATSYSSSSYPMIPFYIYYSMFGYQRFGDLVWAAGDMMARGFIIGATAGRTTLNGEGLQHEDGHNLIMFSMVPNCVSYDPTFAYEMAVIIQDGLRRMYQNHENIFYYITAMNENYLHPAIPVEQERVSGILNGLYLFKKSTLSTKKISHRVQLMGSGTILLQVIAAADLLEKEYSIAADIWSATSFNELRKNIEAVSRYNRLHPDATPQQSHVEQCLAEAVGPVIAATDYMKMYADQIRQAIKQPYYVLGTDGFGRSDSRAMLREFFEVDTKHIAYTAIKALVDSGALPSAVAVDALKRLNIDAGQDSPVTR